MSSSSPLLLLGGQTPAAELLLREAAGGVEAPSVLSLSVFLQNKEEAPASNQRSIIWVALDAAEATLFAAAAAEHLLQQLQTNGILALAVEGAAAAQVSK